MMMMNKKQKSNNDDEETTEDDDEQQMTSRASAFSALLSMEEENGDAGAGIDEEQNSLDDQMTHQIKRQVDNTRKVPKKNKGHKLKNNKKTKAGKKKHGGTNHDAESGEEDLDKLLREIEDIDKERKKRQKETTKRANQKDRNNTTATTLSALTQLLKIDESALNSGDIADNRAAANLRVQSTADFKLIQPHPIWPSPRRLGFRMISDGLRHEHEQLEQHPVHWFRFWHDQTYQRLQQQFWQFQRQHDFYAISNKILREQNPYHLDSLLFMADALERHNENFLESDKHIERGIYACESAIHPSFQILSPEHRLDYVHRENRAFFLLLHWHLRTKIRQHKFKEALQLAKLLFGKDPVGNPLGVLLLIDSLALRANCPNFVLDFYEHFSKSKRLDLLPNFCFSLPLALRSIGETEEAEIYLERAFIRFPFVLSRILDKLQIRADVQIENNYYLNSLAAYRETEGMLLLVNIYLHHSHTLWSDAGTLNWLEHATHRILPRLRDSNVRTEMDEWAKRRKSLFIGLPENVARHCVLHDILVPDTLLHDAHLQIGEEPITDPCPPRYGSREYGPDNLDKVEEEDESNAATNDEVADARQQAHHLIISFLRTLLPEWAKQLLLSLSEQLLLQWRRQR